MHNNDGYDLEEAQSLIGKAIVACDDIDTKKIVDDLRDKSHTGLVEDLLKLNNPAGLFVFRLSDVPPKPRHPKQIEIIFDHVTVRLTLRSDGYVLRWTDGATQTEELEVPLGFDPIAGRFEGREEDEYLVAEPGRPRRKRSAVAVIVDHALKLMKKHPARR